MESNIPTSQLNKLRENLKQNPKMAFYIVGIVVLFIIIVLIVVMNTSAPRQTISQAPKTHITNTPTGFPTGMIEPTKAAISQARTDIISQTQAQLQQSIQIQYTVPHIKEYGDNWAIMEVANPTTDTAHVIVEKVNGTWKVMLGPGTYFTADQLQAIGAPQNLTLEVNNKL